MRAKTTFLGWVIVLAWAVTLPASADWLVTREGASLETRGPWEVEGNRVVFHLLNGQLSSMRIRDVDLDRSAEATATARAQAAIEEPPPPSREAVHEITDKEVPRASRAVLEAERTGLSDDPEQPAARPHRFLKVVNWQRAEASDGGLEILGTIQNTGDNALGNVAVKIVVSDGGEVVKSAYAFLGAPALGPHRSTNFRLPLEDVFSYDDVRFELEGMEIMLRATGSGAPAPQQP